MNIVEIQLQWMQDFFLSYVEVSVSLIDWMEFYPLITRQTYRQVSNIRHTLLGNQFVDHSDVVGASPVRAAPTTSSFST